MNRHYRHIIRAKVQPFQHDNKIKAILAQVAQINANLHGLDVNLTMPTQPIAPRYPINGVGWKNYSFGHQSRGQSSRFAHVKPSNQIMPSLNIGYRI